MRTQPSNSTTNPASYWCYGTSTLYACSCCKDGVTAAPRVASPIAGGLAGPGLFSCVMVSKFAVHIPLYRQQDELAMGGCFRALKHTLGRLDLSVCHRGKPLVDPMRDRVLLSFAINADETLVPVLDLTRDSTRKSGFLGLTWAIAIIPLRCSTTGDSRNRDGPAEFLKN